MVPRNALRDSRSATNRRSRRARDRDRSEQERDHRATLGGIVRELLAVPLVVRARARQLRPEDVQGGTFTLTNPGVFGGITGTPILNQPQVAILGLGAVRKQAVVIDDAVAVRPMMALAVTFDHRAADGMVAFRFLARVRELLETPPGDWHWTK